MRTRWLVLGSMLILGGAGPLLAQEARIRGRADLVLPSASFAQKRDGSQRPNILYIMTDQQHAGMMSCAGNAYLKTPAMDRLASQGTRFELAYCGNPVCLPSRVCMMTGHLPSHFGICSNSSSDDTMPQDALRRGMGWIFRSAGYETAYGGKTHWPRGMSPKTLGFEPLTGNDRDELADACVRFLRSRHDKPFLLVASFINPHDICFMAIDTYTRATGRPPEFVREDAARKCLAAALQQPAGVSREEFFGRLCPPLPRNHEIPALEPECVASAHTENRAFRQFVRARWAEEDWRLHRWAYCRLTEQVDAQIGRVLEAIRVSGLESRTLVVFSSDHGDMDAAHRLEHKSVLYEEAVRVPLIVSYPGVTKPGLVDRTHLVSSGADLIPTLCDYAGIAIPEGLPGRSIRGLAEGRPVASWRDQVVVESQSGRMLRTSRYKYAVYETGAHPEQLTDLERDPGEMANLAEDPAYRDALEDHRARLRRWVEAYRDKMAGGYVPGTRP